MKPQDDESQICVCGHPKRKHRRNGKCSKCGCKEYGEKPHPPACRCQPCSWNRLLALEKEVKTLKGYINEELVPLINKHEYFFGEVFKLTPQDMRDLETLREEEQKAEKVIAVSAVDGDKLQGAVDKVKEQEEKPVQSKAKKPAVTP